LIKKILLFLILIFGQDILAQSINLSENEAFRKTLFYRGLTENDLIFPITFDDPSPTNNFKGILEPVKNMMKKPLESTQFINNFSNLNFKNKSDFEKFIEIIYSRNPNNIIPKINENNLFSTLIEIKNKNDLFRKTLIELIGDKYEFVKNNLSDLFSEDEDGDKVLDIFEFNRVRDESQKKNIEVYEILNSLEINAIFNQDVIDYLILLEITKLDLLKLKSVYNSLDSDLKKKFILGSEKNDIHNITGNEIIAIIDFGGNDIYNINGNVRYIIDMTGNDTYQSENDFKIGSGFFESSFIYDYSGDDKYTGKNFSVGGAVGCVSGIIDEGGNDFYSAQTFCLGAGFFGIGFIQDYSGNDIYNSINYSQGFGMTRGAGLLFDDKGNDSYLIDSRSLDVTRYSDHFISMNQGFAFGLRPYFAGGIGILQDNDGNDIYNSDIFGQGGAYWFGAGFLIDKNGNDKYNGYQYSQGSGVHFAIGVLLDLKGTDFYSTSGVSQGCGHDVGFGLLYDLSGSDNYSAISLSQGAGNANGIGIIFDEEGSDGYLSKDSRNTRGFGDFRRDYGSLGIFTDVSGKDFYSESDYDSSIVLKSRYGMFTDLYEFEKLTSSNNIGNNTLAYPDSSKSYSQDELFIMAKTIDIPYVNFQKYGFNKLVEDSVNTARYITKYLGSDDHRNALVLTNLAQKIGYSMSLTFIEILKKYLNNEVNLSKFEVTFMCSLLGIIKRGDSKDVLLELTYSGENRIVSESINALGKIDYQNDENFKNKVLKRFSEIYNSGIENKNLLKNLSFAFGNYFDNKNLTLLTGLMRNDYYGIRFNAMEVIKKYVNDNFEILNSFLLSDNENDYFKSSVIFSFENLDENKFKEFLQNYSDEKFYAQVSSIIQSKIKNSGNEEFKTFLTSILNEKFYNKTKYKIK